LSGGQIRLSVSDLRDLGASVVGAICVVDREEDGSENLAKDEIVLQCLFRASELEVAGGADQQSCGLEIDNTEGKHSYVLYYEQP